MFILKQGSVIKLYSQNVRHIILHVAKRFS